MNSFQFIFYIFLYSSVISESSFDSYIEKVNKEIETLSKTSKLSGCTYLLKVSLSKGNDKIKTILKNYKGNKSKAYDYIILYILNECSKKISDSEIDLLLHTNKFETFHKKDNKLIRLVDVDEDILTHNENLDLNNELIEISTSIKKAINCEAFENRKFLSNDHEIDIFGMKISPISENKWMIIVIIFILACFGGVIKIIYHLINKKREKRNKKNNQKEE